MAPEPPRAAADTLRDLLSRQAEEMAASAIRTGGKVPADQLEDLGRLARLVELRVTANATPRRWTLPLVALVTLVCISVLLFARTSSTEIEMELKVSEVSFVLPSAQPITNAVNMASLGVSHLRGIVLPDAPAGHVAGSPVDVLLAADSASRRSGTVSIDPIMVSARTRVSLQFQGRHTYRLVLHGATAALAVSVLGPTRLVVPPLLNTTVDYPFPRRIALAPDSDLTSLDFAPLDSVDTGDAFRSPLPAESLSFARIDLFHETDQTLVREVPTISSGTLYFESIDGHARPLRTGEGLRMEWSRGEIHELRLSDEGLLLRFHGTVRGMSTGSGEARRSLMPSVFDWLRARHSLSLLWGAMVYVLGLSATLLGWWKRTV